MAEITEFPIVTKEFDPDNFIGPQGPQGPIGPQGIQGIEGPAGPQGLQGIQGEVGSAGPKGDTGAQGPQGIQGPTGPAGADGTNGVDGEDGREVEIRASGGNLEWRYVGDVAWTVLIAIADLDFSTITDVTLGRWKETEFTTTSAAIDRANGGMQTLNLGAAGVFSLVLAAGESLFLDLTGGDPHGMDWTTSASITWVGGDIPILTSHDHLEFYNKGGVQYGVYIGSVA